MNQTRFTSIAHLLLCKKIQTTFTFTPITVTCINSSGGRYSAFCY